MPNALAVLYCTQDDVAALWSQAGLDARLDDGDDGVVDAREQAAFALAVKWACSRVNLYCQPLYDVNDLATSYLVNDWATILTAYRMGGRRGNPVPDSIKEMAFGVPGTDDKGVMGDLKDVKAMRAHIPDIGYRNVVWPAYSNLTVDPRYRTRQLRVERPISEQTPTQYPQSVDWSSELNFEI